MDDWRSMRSIFTQLRLGYGKSVYEKSAVVTAVLHVRSGGRDLRISITREVSFMDKQRCYGVGPLSLCGVEPSNKLASAGSVYTYKDWLIS
jgi:hypothetical protein